jgi:hypothetical protein
MVRKIKGKKKKAKPKAPARGVKVVTNIHVNSKSGTRSSKQRKGGVGGSVAPSGASTISHVPLVMNVPAPDATQRETKWLHALEDIQSDNIALRMQLDEFTKQSGDLRDPKNKLPFQTPPSKANFEETLVEAEATLKPRGRGRPRTKGVEKGTPIESPVMTRSASQPRLSNMSRSGQDVGLGAAEEEQTPPRGRKPSAKKKITVRSPEEEGTNL